MLITANSFSWLLFIGSDSNTVIYIGAGVGGVVILVVVVCILLCCCYYQRNSHGSEDISKPYTPKRVSVTSDELLIKHSQGFQF